MPVPVGRGDVQALMEDGVLLVEVLEPHEYARAHLPGAVNVPATLLTRRSVARFDRTRPVIVYGFDLQCDLGPRSARLLERFGFESVHDYEGGKADWLAYGLPYEGDGTPVAADAIEACLGTSPDEAADTVLRRLDAEAVDLAVVVDDGDIVLGVLRRETLLVAEPGASAEACMSPAPVTYRPDVTVADLARRLEEAAGVEALVTTSSGRLLGKVTTAGLRRGFGTGEGSGMAELRAPAESAAAV